MKFFVKALIITVLVQVSAYASDPLEDLVYTTEVYPPFNYVESGITTGLSIDLLREVWKKKNIKPRRIFVLPWARAYSELQRQHRNVLFAVARTHEREKLFRWACPIVASKYVLFALKSRKLQFTQLDDIKSLSIATIREDIGEILLIEKLHFEGTIISNVSIEANLHLLDMGRVDLLAYDDKAAKLMFKRFSATPENYEKVFTLASSETCFAFNKQIPKSVVDDFEKTLKDITNSDIYPKLINKYYGE